MRMPHGHTLTRVNLGCGRTPTPGWLNLDNSWSVKLARSPLAGLALAYVNDAQAEFIKYVRKTDIIWADALDLELPSGSMDAIYTSHMLEHLDQREAIAFLKEARRVLKIGGVLRVGVPDIRILVDEYLQAGDANRFFYRMAVAGPKPQGLLARLRYALFSGFRRHNWMYDGASLCMLFKGCGFIEPVIQPPGKTMIADPGLLDLAERAASTVYVEAVRTS